MKKSIIILSALLSIFIQSCTDEPAEREIEYQLAPTFQATSQIRYNNEGGGDIEFIIENNPDSISVSIIRFQFQPYENTLIISKTEIDSPDLVIIDAIFKGTIDIGGVIYQNNSPVGTWTFLYIFYDNNWLRIANESIIGELRSFYNLVYEKISVNNI